MPKTYNSITRYKAAAVQATPIYGNRNATLEKTIAIIEEAGKHEARLIVFPETWIPGFPFWCSHTRGWNNIPERKAYANLYENSIDIPGPITDAICQAAKRVGSNVVVGVNERIQSGTMYNSVIFISRDGSFLGTHRKLIPTFHERRIWGLGDGSTHKVYQTEIGRIGSLICFEHWMPLGRYSLYCQGLQVCASVWPGIGEDSLAVSQHTAREGGCFVILAGSYLTKKDIPSGFQLKEAIEDVPSRILPGGSTIIGPDGCCLTEPLYNKEGIVYANIDLQKILEEKQILDTVGHYARPEVFTLLQNNRSFSSFKKRNSNYSKGYNYKSSQK